VFHILLVLVEGERHGYAIMQEAAESTDRQIKMGPGTLYDTIKRLLEARLIEEFDRRPDPELDDERRRYYRLPGPGQQVVKAEAPRYEQLAAKLARRKRLLGQAASFTLFLRVFAGTLLASVIGGMGALLVFLSRRVSHPQAARTHHCLITTSA
jgi:DNA-binding PadR family transcriptional regulator